VALPTQAALAHPAHSATHSKKKKGKPKREVLVHCASVTVTCKANPHNQGPAGPPGAAGTPGAPGAAGYGVLARLRLSAPVTSTTAAPAVLGLSPATFTQEAGQDEHLLGVLTVTAPTGECQSGKAHTGTLEGEVLIDGQVVGLLFGGTGTTYTPGSVLTAAIAWTNGSKSFELASEVGVLPIASTTQTHTLIAEVQDDCDASGASHFTVDNLAIDVLGAS
jgi:hypothetical protein